MDTNTQSGRRDPKLALLLAFLWSRSFVTFLVLLSCWLLYLDCKHALSRFQVPHHFALQFAVFGRAGWVLDFLCYVAVVFQLTEMLRSTKGLVERVLLIGWIGPFVINPLRMALPQYTSKIWWIEVSLGVVFFLASSLLFIRTIRNVLDERHRYPKSNDIPTRR